MNKLLRSYDISGLEEALGVNHIRRAEIVFEAGEVVTATVSYILSKEQADSVAKCVKEARKTSDE